MKKIKRMLRENLRHEAPDRREDILAAAATAAKRPVRRRTGRLAVAVCGLASVAVAVAVFATGADIWKDAGEQPPAIGGDGGPRYPVAFWECAVDLPDGEAYDLYAFKGREALGREVLSTVNRLFNTDFEEYADLSKYECRLGENPAELFLWGNLDAGMFYYQHVSEYTAQQLAAADPSVIAPQTQTEAAAIVEALTPYVGKVRLAESWREDVEGVDEVYYYYRYTPQQPILTDGHPTRADLLLCFDTLGEVTSLRCDLTLCDAFVSGRATFGENILEGCKQSIGELSVENARVCITGWRVEYVQTIGLEAHGISHPVMTVTYSVNGHDGYETNLFCDLL